MSPSAAPNIPSTPGVRCTEARPKTLASRTPSHGTTGWGGRKRLDPVGGAAKGMPRNTAILPSGVRSPSSAPAVVETSGRVMAHDRAMKLVTGVGGWPGRAPEQARRAEDAGYDIVTCGELAHDSMLTMALAATTTERIELQTSVTIAFPRSPMVLAM